MIYLSNPISSSHITLIYFISQPAAIMRKTEKVANAFPSATFSTALEAIF
jgi:hypothetical protein